MDSVDMLSKIWASATKEQKRRLLKAHGFHESFAETKTIPELVKRSGGMVAKNLNETIKAWQRINPNTKVVFK